MPWSDYDFIGEVLEKVREQLRRHVCEVEKINDYNLDAPAVAALDAILERLTLACDDRINVEKRIAIVQSLAVDIAKLPDEAMPYTQRMVLSLDLEHTAHQELKNNDASEPFAP